MGLLFFFFVLLELLERHTHMLVVSDFFYLLFYDVRSYDSFHPLRNTSIFVFLRYNFFNHFDSKILYGFWDFLLYNKFNKNTKFKMLLFRDSLNRDFTYKQYFSFFAYFIFGRYCFFRYVFNRLNLLVLSLLKKRVAMFPNFLSSLCFVFAIATFAAKNTYKKDINFKKKK